MAAYAFDGASAFSLTAAKAADGLVATVYIVGSPGGMPHADAARVAAIRAAGMGVLPNWERAADFFGTCTVAQAQAAGAEALAACKALGFPADGSITVPFSFDFDIPSSRYPEMLTKLRAVQTGLTGAYRACAYGQEGLIDYLAGHGWPGKHWLMMSTFGNPYNADNPNAFMVQEHRSTGEWLNSPVAGTDINTILDPYALGAWWPDGSPYANGDIVTPADIQAIAAAVWNQPITDTNGSKYKAATFLVSANRRAGDAVVAATRAANAAATVAQAAAVDATAVAGAIRDKLIALINGGA